MADMPLVYARNGAYAPIPSSPLPSPAYVSMKNEEAGDLETLHDSEQPRVWSRGMLVAALGLAGLLLFTFGYVSGEAHLVTPYPAARVLASDASSSTLTTASISTTNENTSKCNPFSSGRLTPSATALGGHVFDTQAPCSPHWFSASLAKQEPLPFLQNQHVLVLGDSVVRYISRGSCISSGGAWRAFPHSRSWEIVGGTGDLRLDYDPLGFECVWDAYNFTLAVGFISGITDYGTPDAPPVRDVDPDNRRATIDHSMYAEFHPSVDHAPYSFDERFQAIQRFWNGHHNAPPSLVLTNFGAWDLRAIYFNDVHLNVSLPVIPPTLVSAYQDRARKALSMLKMLFPHSHQSHLGLHNLKTADDEPRNACLPSTTSTTPTICDPFSSGNFSSTAPHTYTSLAGCQPHDFNALLASKTPLPFLRDKTILLLGDSVTRKMSRQSCNTTGGVWRPFPHKRSWKVVGGTNDGRLDYDPLGYECEWPEQRFRIGVGFIYGMSDFGTPDFPPAREDDGERRATLSTSRLPLFAPERSMPPYSFEERFELAERAWEAHFAEPPSLVVTNFGAWDFRAMFFNDVRLNVSLPTIPSSLVTSFQERAVKAFRLLRTLWPASHHAHISLHDLRTDDEGLRGGWRLDALKQGGKKKPRKDRTTPLLFTPARISQLQEAYGEVTEAEGVDVLDAKRLFAGLRPEVYLKDHIHLSEDFGTVWLWEMVLEHLWRLGEMTP
ncbi:hypothetical protein MNV49_001244 [Pseudohyphozyma bogoriensis]|nr:hypothetical protein MNV49_001244 [Pseudohyphozyma bogoriensis]